jgi:DNA-binding XRE family transcriptional regulator
MANIETRTLKASEIREIGEAIFRHSWQGEMARAIGVHRQSIGHYLKVGL